MSKTGRFEIIEGELKPVHVCDWCEDALDDGRPYLYWEHKDFTLCQICLIKGAGAFGAHRRRGRFEPVVDSGFSKTAIPQELREDVFVRDNYMCRYCGDRRRLTVDHVIPEVNGGPTALENLVTACKSCNSRKGPRTPDEAGMELRDL